MTYEELRLKHPKFVYKGFNFVLDSEDLKISFDFSLEPDIVFKPKIIFPGISKERFEKNDKEVLDNLIFHLGMVEMISYWKAACSPEILIKAGSLTNEQKGWWKDLLINGLGEFFYINKIDFTDPNLVILRTKSKGSLNFNHKQSLRSKDLEIPRFARSDTDRSLVLVGGGKDSAVSLELFKELGKDFTPLLLNPTKAALDITSVSGANSPIVIKRTVDPKLLDLNSQGYLNGHTPFSAYLAFLGLLSGVLYDFKDIVVSNEASSNEGNIEYLGKVVNHQYSKTFEFENKFRRYSSKYLSSVNNYYSFLRPLTELQIAKLFSKMEKYHPLFRSCNRGSKTNSWCGNCAKCLFAFIILKPYLKKKTDQIFGSDLLEKEELKPILSQLLREENTAKPFDCVGLVDETKAALYLIDPKKYSEFKEASENLDDQWNSKNNLTGDLVDFLRKKIDEA